MYQLATMGHPGSLASSDMPELLGPGAMTSYLSGAAPLGETPLDNMATLSKVVAVGGILAVMTAFVGAAKKRPRLTKNAAGLGMAAGGLLALISGLSMAQVHSDLTEAESHPVGSEATVILRKTADKNNSMAFGHLVLGAPILLASGAALMFLPTRG